MVYSKTGDQRDKLFSLAVSKLIEIQSYGSLISFGFNFKSFTAGETILERSYTEKGAEKTRLLQLCVKAVKSSLSLMGNANHKDIGKGYVTLATCLCCLATVSEEIDQKPLLHEAGEFFRKVTEISPSEYPIIVHWVSKIPNDSILAMILHCQGTSPTLQVLDAEQVEFFASNLL